jgi:hypothetical protein
MIQMSQWPTGRHFVASMYTFSNTSFFNFVHAQFCKNGFIYETPFKLPKKQISTFVIVDLEGFFW